MKKLFIINKNFIFGASDNAANMQEGKDFLSKDVYKLKSFHTKNPKFLIYLNSNDFKKEKNRMIRFLQEFASDSESIPSCNN